MVEHQHNLLEDPCSSQGSLTDEIARAVGSEFTAFHQLILGGGQPVSDRLAQGSGPRKLLRRWARISRADRLIPKVIWNQPLGLPECPYMRRWVLDFGAFALRLHRWESSDDHRAFHDHAWNFWTFVLRGSYVDVSDRGKDVLRAGSLRYRPATHRHTVKILQPGTWTLVLSGPVIRRWGFWVGGKLWKRDRYFAVMGHHPCSDGQAPVRRRPDGSMIR